MNKKKFLALVALLTLAVCSGIKHCEHRAKSMDGKRVLVVYFSHKGETYKLGRVDKGNTEFVVDHIVELTGADTVRIVPTDNYDKPYEELTACALEEAKKKAMPGYKKINVNPADYDVIMIGAPVWWYTYPRFVFTFMRDYSDALKHKTLVPFTTAEGSGLGKTEEDLQKLFPEARHLQGFTITGREARKPEAKQKVSNWLKKIGSNCK